MKIMIAFVGLLITLAGLLHFFSISLLPSKGIGYALVLIVLAVIIIILAIINQLLMGFEKFFLILQALLLIGIALLQFIPSLLPIIPREGFFYAGMVILVGALGLLYGIMGMG